MNEIGLAQPERLDAPADNKMSWTETNWNMRKKLLLLCPFGLPSRSIIGITEHHRCDSEQG